MAEIIVEKTVINDIKEMYKDDVLADRVKQYIVYDHIPCISAVDYKVGDEVIYISADSILTDKITEVFELKLNKNRIKPIKIWGYRSLGIILPVKFTEETFGVDSNSETLAEDLGIKKYEQPTVTGPSSYGGPGWGIPCPTWMPEYTSIEHYFRNRKYFKEDDIVCIHEKRHGMNVRFGMNIHELDEDGYPTLYVGSHTKVRKMDERDFFWQTAIKYDIRNKLIKFLDKFEPAHTIVIYGERFGKNDNGSNIQHLTYGAEDTKFEVFDIDINHRFMNYFELQIVIDLLELNQVPLLYHGVYDHEVILQLKNGQSVDCDQIKEGVVIRLQNEEHRQNKRMIFKAIGDEYLFEKTGKPKTEFKE